MTQIFPAPVVPTGMTIAVAMSQGLLPVEVQITGFGNGAANPTLGQLIANGTIQVSALASTLTYASPSANYGGN